MAANTSCKLSVQEGLQPCSFSPGPVRPLLRQAMGFGGALADAPDDARAAPAPHDSDRALLVAALADALEREMLLAVRALVQLLIIHLCTCVYTQLPMAYTLTVKQLMVAHAGRRTGPECCSRCACMHSYMHYFSGCS